MSHARKDQQRNYPLSVSHDWPFGQSENESFSSGKPHVCDRPPVSRCEEARLAIRHFAQLTKRIAKCRKRNPAPRILLRAICVAQINAIRCGKNATPPRSASGRVPHAACVRRIARRHSAGKGPLGSAIVGRRVRAGLRIGTIKGRPTSAPRVGWWSGATAFERFGRSFPEACGVFA